MDASATEVAQAAAVAVVLQQLHLVVADVALLHQHLAVVDVAAAWLVPAVDAMAETLVRLQDAQAQEPLTHHTLLDLFTQVAK